MESVSFHVPSFPSIFGLESAPWAWSWKSTAPHALHWLGESDLRSVGLGFEEAGRVHGGSGALTVRLRRG